MNRRVLAVLAVAGLALIPAASAQASENTGPCATQQALFEKHNIEFNMNAPLVAYAYNTACGVTG
jgi:hypothetical protein